MLLHRAPGMWVPQRKPLGGFKRWERDPQARLAQALALALVIDGPAGLGSVIDYAAPARAFTVKGSPTYGTGVYGPQVTGSFAVAQASFTIAPTFLPGTKWSFDCLCKFDGTSASQNGGVLLTQGINNDWLFGWNSVTPFPFIIGNFNTQNYATTTTVTSYSTWTRIGATYDGTTAKLFANGKLVETPTAGGTGTISSLGLSEVLGDFSGPFSWGWPVADLFFWTRTLNDGEMLAHAIAPYRTVLRPRWEDRPRGAMIGPPFIQRDLPPCGKVELVAY